MKDTDLVFPCGINCTVGGIQGDWTREDIVAGAKSLLRAEDQRIIDMVINDVGGELDE